MKILCLHTNTGSRFYRVIPQLKWMQEKGHEVRLESHDSPDLDSLLEWCDVLLLQMVFSQQLVQEAKAMGKKVIFECDDLVHKTHEKHYAYKETKTLWQRVVWLWRIFRMLRSCDGFICTTDELKKAYGWMAKRTLVFDNYLDLPHWLKEKKVNKTDRVRILWAGSTSHTGDLEWVKPIMGKILEKYPQVQFIYIGYGGVPTDDLYAKFVYGEDIFEGLPQHRRESLLPAPPNVFPYILASVQADIAIAPLEKNHFNRFKSQCKYLEYAINGIPGVYSKWFYTKVEDEKEGGGNVELFKYYDLPVTIATGTGLVADTPEQWIEALSLLIENATLRNKIGENAREVAIQKYNFATYAPRWQEFVESIYVASHSNTRITKNRRTQQIGREQYGLQ